ncbi:MAG: hypothetical protein ACSHWZ_03485 [Sulfitobacter sp.]
MTYSANEIMMLCAKAARGAGAFPAQAAHFGRAALAHLAAGRAEAALIAALDALPDGPITRYPQRIAALVETAEMAVAIGPLKGTEDPLMLSYLRAQTFEAIILPNGQVQLNLQTPAPLAPPARFTPSAAFLSQLSALAAKILVPETDASRRSGAGAGLTDND